MTWTPNVLLRVRVNGSTLCAAHADAILDAGVCSGVAMLRQGDAVSVRGASGAESLWGTESNGFSGFLVFAL